MVESLMRYVVTALVSATLLIHGLVGCSQHCESDCAHDTAVAAPAPSAGGCCHHRIAEKAQNDDPPSAPCKCKLECKQSCVSLPPERVSLDGSTATLPPAILSVFVNSSLDLTLENSHAKFVRYPLEHEARVRLHLALHVLLI